jgi:hypothetical protein
MKHINNYLNSQMNIKTIILIKKFIYVLCGTILVLYFLPYILLIKDFEIESIKGSFSILGTIGDTLNGIFNPLIGALAVITTFLAFIVQFKANENQRNDIKIERFENKFYEMIRLHRENVIEVEIDGIFKGRIAFEKMYDELRFIYNKLKTISSKYFQPSEIWIAKVSYYHFFKGINRNSNTLSKIEAEIAAEKEFLKYILNIHDQYELHKRDIQKNGGNISNYPFDACFHEEDDNYYFHYKPFLGYSSKLGHYYRHLYQSLKLASTDPVLKRNDSKEEFKIKYQYIKLLRVQLSNSEQSMIYFNSFFSSGQIWWEDSQFKNAWNKPLSYFLGYAIIKNIQLN